MSTADDPAAPLVAQIEAMAGHMAHHRLPLDDCDPIICTCRGLHCGDTVGDLRAGGPDRHSRGGPT